MTTEQHGPCDAVFRLFLAGHDFDEHGLVETGADTDPIMVDGSSTPFQGSAEASLRQAIEQAWEIRIVSTAADKEDDDDMVWGTDVKLTPLDYDDDAQEIQRLRQRRSDEPYAIAENPADEW